MSATIVVPATASTLSSKKAQAAAVQKQLSALADKAEIASEAYNSARDQYDAVTAKVTAIEARIAALNARTKTLQTALGNRADAMYRDDGTLGVVEALLSAHSIEDLNSTIELLTRISEQDATTVSTLKQTRVQAEAARRTLAVAQATALIQKKSMAANATAVRAQIAARSKLLASLKSDIKALIKKQKEAEAKAAAARARALRRSSASSSYSSGGNPPTSSKGAAAVWWAKKALGKPYSWGASGPSSFDCSGLTMWAYRHVGINLAHYSRSQYTSGPHVSRANLEPGDLVFFGSPIHHVGMYVGGGNFIEAPYTGTCVRISSLSGRSDYVGATRPN
jgi:cell wall-associated NlpC family hydrolase